MHSEFLLDRIAANYVSFTLIEESDINPKEAGSKPKKFESFKKENTQKERFFKGIYDIIA